MDNLSVTCDCYRCLVKGVYSTWHVVAQLSGILHQTMLPVQGAVCVSQIITGVGKHSINGRPKILPAVVRYLSDAGYRFTETLGNSGVLEVNIGGHRRLLDG